MLVQKPEYLIWSCPGHNDIAHARRQGVGPHGKHNAAIKTSQAYGADCKDLHGYIGKFPPAFSQGMNAQNYQQRRSEYQMPDLPAMKFRQP